MRLHLSIEEQGAPQIGGKKRKILQLSLTILLVSCLFGASVNAQGFDKNDIRAIAGSLAKDLTDPFDKLQLANDIRSFFEWRKRIQGFPIRAELEQKFKDAFAVFVTALYTKDLRGAEKRLQNGLLTKMIDAYKKNQDNFEKFYQSVQKRSPYYSKKLLTDMRKEIVQFAVVLNESGTDALNILMQFTGIWPFC